MVADLIKQERFRWAGGISLGVLLYFFVVYTFPITPDYFFYYGIIPKQIMSGEVQLFDTDVVFGLLPWIVPSLALISLLPLMYGQSAHFDDTQ